MLYEQFNHVKHGPLHENRCSFPKMGRIYVGNELGEPSPINSVFQFQPVLVGENHERFNFKKNHERLRIRSSRLSSPFRE
jgi:hypothetical protein